MKSFVFLIAIGIVSGFSLSGKDAVTERNLNRKEDKNISPLASEHNPNQQYGGLVEVKEEDIPEGTIVYVMEEIDLPRPEGESLSTADNIVFRPLFQYRNKQEALQRRRISNGYRRRYFVQKPYRPYRNSYYYYYPGYQYY